MKNKNKKDSPAFVSSLKLVGSKHVPKCFAESELKRENTNPFLLACFIYATFALNIRAGNPLSQVTGLQINIGFLNWYVLSEAG